MKVRNPLSPLTNGPIPNTGGFLHILFAIVPLFLSILGLIVYYIKVNTSNNTVGAVFLTLLTAITAGYSTYNAYNTYKGGFTRSNSFWSSFAAVVVLVISYTIAILLRQ